MVLKAGTGPPSAADIRFGEQVTETITRDLVGRISSVAVSSSNPASSSVYTVNRDSFGRVSTVTSSGDFSRTLTITRDSSGRISSVNVV